MDFSNANKVTTFMLGTVGGVLAITNSVYGLVINPSGNVILFTAVSLASCLPALLGILLFVRYRSKVEDSLIEQGIPRKVKFYPRDQIHKNTFLLGGIFSIVLFVVIGSLILNNILIPELKRIEVSSDDSETIVLYGKQFGSTKTNMLVYFDDKLQTPESVSADFLSVVVPKGFTQGNIEIRRGPRSSNRLHFRYPGIVFDVAVVALIDPTEVSSIQKIMDKIEPFPAFPYYSHPSDDPSAWPPKVHEMRAEFGKQIRRFLTIPSNQEKVRQFISQKNESRVEILSAGGVDESLFQMQLYSNLRMYFYNELNADISSFANSFGDIFSEGFVELEKRRKELRKRNPNRLAIIRIENQQTQDVKSLKMEIDARGFVFDVTLNDEQGHSESMKWTPSHKIIGIEVMPPGYVAEVRIWYKYLPLSERVFAGPADLLWEKTQGIRIKNISISNGRVRRNQALLSQLVAYERFDVDPTSEFDSQY